MSTWLYFKISLETYLWHVFLKRFNWGGMTQLESGWHHCMSCRMNERTKCGEHSHPSLSTSWLWPASSCSCCHSCHNGLCSQTVSPNKPFLSLIVFIRYFITTTRKENNIMEFVLVICRLQNVQFSVIFIIVFLILSQTFKNKKGR